MRRRSDPLGPAEFRISQTEGDAFVFLWFPDAVYNPLAPRIVVPAAGGSFEVASDRSGFVIRRLEWQSLGLRLVR